LQKTSGAGFYFHVGPAEFLVAAGVYMPEREQLLAIRRHLSGHHAEFRSLMKAKKLRGLMEVNDEVRMTRPPKGFAADDPAVDLLMCKQWGVSTTLPVERALLPSVGKDIVERFKAAAGMVAFLNAPLVVKVRRPLF
jgi:uncharacterized protein (TIGR02453 family)